ncbi:MAG: indolepyruvate ferredoxin oxidoreductase family protein [Candidatus Kariarchaeaceae archaeon]|jgi:indolepyruvate ferredoxin oxidoreductase
MENSEQFSLSDKYEVQEGTVILSGIQALVRLPLDQHAADKRAGLDTATFISGYRGSPLGGLDAMLMRNQMRLEENNVVFLPGVNEDLGATAVYGSQMANILPNPKFDGVLGMWYGKGPGVDRSGDIFKHANYAGVGKFGGVLAIGGDDPVSKSSTLPSHSETAFYDAQMPILYPGTIEEVLTLGRYGFELSRYSGLWVGFKIVTDIADGFGTARVQNLEIVKPEFEYNGQPWSHSQNPTLLPIFALQQEKELYEARLHAAELFAEANGINEIKLESDQDKIGIVAAGKTYYDLKEALYLIGLDDRKLRKIGVRLLKLGMIFPIERTIVNDFANSLDEVFVIEEKRGLMEILIKDVLYNSPTRPLVIGKHDEHGDVLIPAHGELVVKDLINPLFSRLEPYMDKELRDNFLSKKKAESVVLDLAGPSVNRTPYFCSGCPHNSSTVVPDGSLSGGGIGCHGLALMMDRNTIGLLHMGGEGVPWVGASYFSEMDHMFQNLGDGTLFHSGYLAIRQAIAAQTNITYKILYNSAVAMTGGQPVDGNMPVPNLTRALEAEGVKQIYVLADYPDKYPRNALWAENVTVWPRERIDEAQRILREIEGVTILIYDHPCAADIRRKRKRGTALTPKRQIFINERVCEGCGDCGVKSNCLSVFPVETEFGRKTQIHQSSCNRDYTCLKGDCPAFVTVEVEENGTKKQTIEIELDDIKIPDPDLLVGDNANIYMTGIGGTGVVTSTQIIATAAMLDGKFTSNLDQTGLSQKGGSVVSHIKIRTEHTDISNRIPYGETDTMLVFDVLTGATDMNLKYTHPDKTRAVVSRSTVPTGAMVRKKEVEYPEIAPLLARIERSTISKDNFYIDAISLAENVFANHMPANMITIGAAFQKGMIPLSKKSIFSAIELNGVAVEMNKQAFTLGRLTVSDPENVLIEMETKLHRAGSLDDHIDVEIPDELERQLVIEDKQLRRLVTARVRDLIDYQNKDYAEKYLAFILKVHEQDPDLSKSLTQTVARYLHKFMAYKDEYEVARLYLHPGFEKELERQFGSKYKMKYQLHPPMLREIGFKNKIGLGRWFKTGYKLLYRMRALRGTPLDIFGYANVRRTERQLIKEYLDLIERLLPRIDLHYEEIVQIAELPDIVRGYEGIKMKNVEEYRRKIETMMSEI